SLDTAFAGMTGPRDLLVVEPPLGGIFQGGHENYENLENYFSELRALRAFVVNTSCAREAAKLFSVIV
ncbi:MAG: hypothetical protein ACXWWP_09205, partial [Candidatus Binatia bacterium]